MFVRKRLRVPSKYCRQALSSKLFCLTLSAVFVRVFATLLRAKGTKIERLFCRFEGVDALWGRYLRIFLTAHTQQTQTAFRRQCLSESVWRVSSKYCRQALPSKLFCVMLSAVFVRFLVVSRLRGRIQSKIVRLSCVKQGKTS